MLGRNDVLVCGRHASAEISLHFLPFKGEEQGQVSTRHLGLADELHPPVLRLSGITKRFGALVANDDISLELASGEVLALLGENGAGKSTLVSILFGHYVADVGSIEVFGRPLPPGDPPPP